MSPDAFEVDPQDCATLGVALLVLKQFIDETGNVPYARTALEAAAIKSRIPSLDRRIRDLVRHRAQAERKQG